MIDNTKAPLVSADGGLTVIYTNTDGSTTWHTKETKDGPVTITRHPCPKPLSKREEEFRNFLHKKTRLDQ